ncbi:4259_t:CDS:2 [Acaulospora colombiana]|uniref:4259_t:CDS:1 n=1 Tax=Acaulospora colombiana TaxID=27376 RepID=A0ACA9KBK8_9GLOM|nr:4259_t:CDS:2 [Acaulospora colombiana]
MDYASILKSLAREAGIAVPSNAFSKSRSHSSIMEESQCSRCGESQTSVGWCKACDTAKLKAQFGNWTSGNEDLDNFIRDTQINANTPFDFIRWIPFENFEQLEFVARGGFGSVYSAKSENWGKVALKFLDNSEELTQDFLDELRAHHRCSLGSGIIDCYGVSKDPETNRYVMVMRYAEQGNLRRYLTQYFSELSWDTKIELFDRIAKGLQGIHDAGLVHRDFHSGNILRHEKLVYVTDLGMCRPANESVDAKKVYGVLPYVAPEVLRGEPYTQAADIYSLGMIMWEMSSNEPPFADRAHNYLLARDICEGLRPPIISGTPKGYVAAMLRCWDADPHKRPSASELLNVSYKWRYLSDGNAPFQGPKTNKKVKTSPVVRSSPTNAQHPQAFYTSRLLHYPNLPEPKNSDYYTLFDSSSGEIYTMVRKQSNKREPPRPITDLATPKPRPIVATVDKGKEKEKTNDNNSSGHRREATRSMTMGKYDKDMLERLRAERKKLALYRWSSVINEVPQQVEFASLSGKVHKD